MRHTTLPAMLSRLALVVILLTVASVLGSVRAAPPPPPLPPRVRVPVPAPVPVRDPSTPPLVSPPTLTSAPSWIHHWIQHYFPHWLSFPRPSTSSHHPDPDAISFAPALGVHIGGPEHDGLIAWADYSSSSSSSHSDVHATTNPLVVRSRPARYRRLRDPHTFARPRAYGDWDQVLTSSHCLTEPSGAGWEDVTVRAPNVTDRETILSLSRMAAQAYVPGNTSWTPGTTGFNQSLSFGWDSDGIRGHVFADATNSTVVVAIKGTTAAFMPGGGGDTAKRDKVNDNLLFSCCCARVSWTWTTVCGCYHATSKGKGCGQSCVEGALLEKSFYYRAATELYSNITTVYPHAQIWLTGHSLGGALSSLIGMTYGLPTVAFEAPGERMAARRLHLPVPGDHQSATTTTTTPTTTSTEQDDDDDDGDDGGLPIEELPIVHVYHTADPLALGQCVGQMSPCGQFGYAMESRCHAGQSIVYDTVNLLGWSPSLLTHRIITLTDDLLLIDWNERVASGLVAHQPVHTQALTRPMISGTSFLKWRWPWPWNPPTPPDDDSSSAGSSSDGGGDGSSHEGDDPSFPPGDGQDDSGFGPGLPDPHRGGDEHLPVPKARYEHSCEDCVGWKFGDDL